MNLDLTKREVRDKYDYVPVDKGRPLLHKYDKQRVKRGDPVGSYCSRGNIYKTTIKKKSLMIHRLVWLHQDRATHNYSQVPKILDHINQDYTDNRYENLRPVDASLNGINSKLNPDSRGASKYRGVNRHLPCKKNGKQYCYWKAILQNKLIKMFPYTRQGEIDAALAYDRAVYKKFGETNGLNFPENKTNYLGLDEHEQLVFGFCDGLPAQQILDLSDVVLVR